MTSNGDGKLAKIQAILAEPFAIYLNLSPTERKVARLALVGKTNREIADEMALARSTVGTHLLRIRRKTGMSKAHFGADVIRQVEEVLRERE